MLPPPASVAEAGQSNILRGARMSESKIERAGHPLRLVACAACGNGGGTLHKIAIYVHEPHAHIINGMLEAAPMVFKDAMDNGLLNPDGSVNNIAMRQMIASREGAQPAPPVEGAVADGGTALPEEPAEPEEDTTGRLAKLREIAYGDADGEGKG